MDPKEYKKYDMISRLLRNPYLWGFFAGFLTFFIMASVQNFIFYGRHVIFLYPFFIFAIAYMVNEIWEKRYLLMLRYLLIASLLLILLVSGLQLRFSPKYFKDDYILNCFFFKFLPLKTFDNQLGTNFWVLRGC